MALFSAMMGEGLLISGDFSDFTLHCGGTSFKVHRPILAPVSPFFKGLVGTMFKEGAEKEATVKETTPIALAMMLRSIYTGRYEDARDFRNIGNIFPGLGPYRSPGDWKLDKPKSESPEDSPDHKQLNAQNLKRMHESKLQEQRNSVRLYELACRFMMPRLAEKVAASLVKDFTSATTRPVENHPFDLNSADAATLLTDIYDIEGLHRTPGIQRLHTMVMAKCIHYRWAVWGESDNETGIMKTILRHEEMRRDWEMGVEVAKLLVQIKSEI